MVNSMCVLIRKSPYGTEDAFAGLRLGLATIANGMETKIIMMEDGVFCAKKNQRSQQIHMPSIIDTINDLISLEVKIYCVEDNLAQRGIKKEDLIEELNFISEKEISDIILNCDAQTSF